MPKITVYTTTTCPFCKMQKDFFREKNVAFEEILVDENPDKAREMIAISGQMGVPFTVIEKDNGEQETILGFDPERLTIDLDLH